jgi:hypothetical protein
LQNLEAGFNLRKPLHALFLRRTVEHWVLQNRRALAPRYPFMIAGDDRYDKTANLALRRLLAMDALRTTARNPDHAGAALRNSI